MPQTTAPVLSKTEKTTIGKTCYIVTTHFKENARETAEQKLLQYVANRIEAELKPACQPV